MIDVTTLFQDAAKSLTVKNSMLCKKDSFNLQDSMAALEIMDPKMDCCQIPASQVAPYGRMVSTDDERMVFPRPAPIGLDDVVDPLPWNELSLLDASVIVVECLSRLESLMGGASVVESTFTCLYAHAPVVKDMKERLEPSPMASADNAIDYSAPGTLAQWVVYASVLILLELTEVIRGIILNADIFEEEDFTVNSYGIVMFQDRDEHTATNAVKHALKQLADDMDKDSDEAQAISIIFAYEMDLLAVCVSMARLSGKAVAKQVDQSQKTVKAAVAKLEALPDIVKRLKQQESNATKCTLKKTFDSYVTRPLVGNAPVRRVDFREVETTISSLIKTTNELDWALCGLILHGNTLGRIRRMLSRISKSSANILTRSLLVLNLYFDDQLLGQYSLQEQIIGHMQQLSHIPDEVFQNMMVQAFLSRLAKPVYDLLKAMLLNRNRQRAYMEAVMLPDWSTLSQEASVVDHHLMKDAGVGPDIPPHFSHYALYLTIDCMDHYVSLGLELKLTCGDYELAVAYWYRDFLLSALINQVAMMRQYKDDANVAKQLSAANAKRGKKKGAKSKKPPTNGNQRPQPEDVEDEVDFMVIQLKRILCRGLVRFFASTHQAGLIPERNYEFTSKEQIFQKRYEAFEMIQQPPLLRYADYVAGSDFSKVPPHDLLASTSECFQAARTYVDRLLAQSQSIPEHFRVLQNDEINRLAKVTIGNTVFVLKLQQKVENGFTVIPKGNVEFDLETHNHFCTIRIT